MFMLPITLLSQVPLIFIDLVLSFLYIEPVLTNTSRIEQVRSVDVSISVSAFITISMLLMCALLFSAWEGLHMLTNRVRSGKSPFRKHECKTNQFENLGFLD